MVLMLAQSKCISLPPKINDYLIFSSIFMAFGFVFFSSIKSSGLILKDVMQNETKGGRTITNSYPTRAENIENKTANYIHIYGVIYTVNERE